MHHDGGKLLFINFCFGGSHNIAVGAWHKLSQLFSRKAALWAEATVTFPHISYVSCPQQVDYFKHLLNLVPTLRNSPTLCDDIVYVMVLQQPYDKLSFIRSLLKWRRDFDSERLIKSRVGPFLPDFMT